ncbi:CGNR zinc finger domain-containing protein [Agromyces humatus]|uniref:CGNR zinc finger domain-containing protein n=1 Tax=Agromyces humatus TaxID=279573 RepID=A0ABP4X099_9MICO|nr:CGNR zinc finger domain-containing protein [Agromyces humatus]
MNETLLLDLVNSRLVSSDGVHDELADDRAAVEWLRRHGAPHGPVQVADARAVRAALVPLLRDEVPVSVLAPWIAAMRRTATLSADGLEWVDGTPPDKQVGSAVVQEWADLQNAGGRPRIRPCEADDCQHFLIDRSRANNRRWHSMETCGNREKARRHYARSKEAAA